MEQKIISDKADTVQSQPCALLPFLELPIVVTNTDGKSKEVEARIQPVEIDYYYPGINEGTVIVNKSRSSYLTLLSAVELDQALRAYRDAVTANPGVFGVLKITPKTAQKPLLHVTD
jgi:hypothetical protein